MRNRSRRLELLAVASVVVAVFATMVGAVPAYAAGGTVNVTTTADIVDGTTTSISALNAAPGADGQISLREATLAADNTPSTQAQPNQINLPTGTFNLTQGEIAVGSGTDLAVNIAGAGAATIVHQSTASSRVFDHNPSLAPNARFGLSGMTVVGGVAGAFGGGGLVAGGTGNVVTIANVIFNGNSTASAQSGGAINFGGGGTLNVSDSRFATNIGASAGGAIYVDMAGEAGSVSLDEDAFIGNSATTGQGGAVALASGGSASFTVSNSTFVGNAAGNGQGGAIQVASGALTAHSNRIVDNTGTTKGVYAAGTSTANVTGNWWGCNAGPGNGGCDSTGGSGTVTSTPRIVLSAVAVPTSVNIGGTSTVTAGFSMDSAGTPLASPAALSGLDVAFSGAGGSVSPASASTGGGPPYTAVTTFTGTNAGSRSASATVDNQTVQAAIEVNGPPIVTGNPSNATVCQNSQASFTAAADGSPTPTVQWQASTDGGATFNNIAGATSTTLSFNAVAADDGNEYRAVFTNSADSATTTAATLTVNTAPVITGNPANQGVNAGDTATFTSAATGKPAPTVQWQQSTDGGGTFHNIAGAMSTTLSFVTNAGEDGNQYRAVYTNACGSATTSAATLSLNSGPDVMTQPSDQTVCQGNPVSFTATATGSPTPTVQWQVSTDGGATFHDIPGEMSTTLAFSPVAGDNGNQYHAVFTNDGGTATSTAATLTVNVGPQVSLNPANQGVAAGSAATFTAAATGKPTPTVQWQVSTDGGATFNNVAGATSTTLSFTTNAGQNGNRYRAVFTNTCGSATTTAATLSVNSGPQVQTNPTDATVCAGDPVTFTAAASGAPTPTVQWQVSTNGGTSYTNLAGATTTTLAFTATFAQNGNKYRAVFTNTGGSATTTAALLTVHEAPAITLQPTDYATFAGSPAAFVAAANGSPPPTVQWQVSTNSGATFTNIPGATFNTLTFTAALSQNGYQYRAVFTNGCGSATTNAATLRIATKRLLKEALPNAIRYRTYSVQLAVPGAKKPVTYSVQSGALPPGFVLTHDGLLTGFPEHVADYAFTVVAVGSDGSVAIRDYTLKFSSQCAESARVNHKCPP